jgi:hypothetical protein
VIWTGLWFSPDPPVSSTNKTDRQDITEILLKVALNTIKQTSKKDCKQIPLGFVCNMIIIITLVKSKVCLPQVWVNIPNLGYPVVDLLVYLLPKAFILFSFQTLFCVDHFIDYEAYLMKVVTEMCRAH